MKKYYAIKKGRQTGIFTSWDETKSLVSGFNGAIYKSFKTKEEALNFLNDKTPTKSATSHLETATSADIILFTDGGSRNHGNVLGGHVKDDDPAAWSYLVISKELNIKKAKSGGEFGATNNRMEIMALLEGLSYLYRQNLNQKSIKVITDSKYVLNSITKGWLNNWQRGGWKKDIKNLELWQDMAQVLTYFPNLNFEWTKGHNINQGNIFVDELLNREMDQMH